MNSRRLIFVRSPREVSLTPVYIGLLLVAIVSVLGLAFALWTPDRAPERQRQGANTSEPGAPFDGAQRVPARPKEMPGRTRGI